MEARLPEWSKSAAVAVALLGAAYLVARAAADDKRGQAKVKPGKKARQKASKRKLGDADATSSSSTVATPASTPAAVPPTPKRQKPAPAVKPPVVVASVDEAVRQAQAAPESDFPSLAAPTPAPAPAKGKGKKGGKAAPSFAAAAAKPTKAPAPTSNGRPSTADSAIDAPSASSNGASAPVSADERDNGERWESRAGSDDEYAGSWESVGQSTSSRSKPTSRAASTFASPARVVPGAAPAPATKKARSNASKTAVVRDAKADAEAARLEALRQHRAAAAAASAAAARPKPRSVPAASSSSSKAVGGGMHATIADDSLIWEP